MVELTEAEREQLLRWSRRAKSAQALALRSRVVLACADGLSNNAIAGYIRWGNRRARPKQQFAVGSKIRRPDYLPNVA